MSLSVCVAGMQPLKIYSYERQNKTQWDRGGYCDAFS
jgi:hypothetical protein